MYKEIGQKIQFLNGKTQHFIAFIGPLLKPLRVEENQHIFRPKDPIEEIFFLIAGKAGFCH
jgi:hypothetical protein